MDAFSRAIVGFDCSDSLEREGAIRALHGALGQLPAASGAYHVDEHHDTADDERRAQLYAFVEARSQAFALGLFSRVALPQSIDLIVLEAFEEPEVLFRV